MQYHRLDSKEFVSLGCAAVAVVALRIAAVLLPFVMTVPALAQQPSPTPEERLISRIANLTLVNASLLAQVDQLTLQIGNLRVQVDQLSAANARLKAEIEELKKPAGPASPKK